MPAPNANSSVANFEMQTYIGLLCNCTCNVPRYFGSTETTRYIDRVRSTTLTEGWGCSTVQSAWRLFTEELKYSTPRSHCHTCSAIRTAQEMCPAQKSVAIYATCVVLILLVLVFRNQRLRAAELYMPSGRALVCVGYTGQIIYSLQAYA